MSEPMSPGEMGRSLTRIERDTSELRRDSAGWREIVIRLQHQVAENSKDIEQINVERRAEAEQRKKDRRLIFAAFIAPVVVVLIGSVIQIYLAAGGM